MHERISVVRCVESGSLVELKSKIFKFTLRVCCFCVPLCAANGLFCDKHSSTLQKISVLLHSAMAQPISAIDVFSDWRAETIWRYMCENGMSDVYDWIDVERLVEQVKEPPVAFVFADSIDQDPPVPYWSEKDVTDDCRIHHEDGLDPVVTLALRPDQMREFLSSLLLSAF